MRVEREGVEPDLESVQHFLIYGSVDITEPSPTSKNGMWPKHIRMAVDRLAAAKCTFFGPTEELYETIMAAAAADRVSKIVISTIVRETFRRKPVHCYRQR